MYADPQLGVYVLVLCGCTPATYPKREATYPVRDLHPVQNASGKNYITCRNIVLPACILARFQVWGGFSALLLGFPRGVCEGSFSLRGNGYGFR